MLNYSLQITNFVTFTVGTIRNSALLFQMGYFTVAEQRSLQQTAVGDVFSPPRFIDALGRIVNQDINSRTVSIHLDELKKKKYSILVAANVAKVPPIHGSLTIDYANTPIIGQECTNDLLEYSN